MLPLFTKKGAIAKNLNANKIIANVFKLEQAALKIVNAKIAKTEKFSYKHNRKRLFN